MGFLAVAMNLTVGGVKKAGRSVGEIDGARRRDENRRDERLTSG